MLFLNKAIKVNQLSGVVTNLYGQFICNETGEVATVLVSINDMLIAWERMPTNTICNCSGCMANYSFPSNQELSGGYSYGQENYFQIQVITNEICIAFANVTLQYSPVQIQLLEINPTSGPTTGDTSILISGSFSYLSEIIHK